MTRRTALQMGAGTAAAALLGSGADAAPADAEAAIAQFADGKSLQQGGITIDLPDAVEDGSSVPISVVVESPMTVDNHVTNILVVSEGNPFPRLVAFRFTPLSGRAEAATRIRLAQAQDVIVVAKTSDGRVLTARKRVDVTVGACTG